MATRYHIDCTTVLKLSNLNHLGFINGYQHHEMHLRISPRSKCRATRSRDVGVSRLASAKATETLQKEKRKKQWESVTSTHSGSKQSEPRKYSMKTRKKKRSTFVLQFSSKVAFCLFTHYTQMGMTRTARFCVVCLMPFTGAPLSPKHELAHKTSFSDNGIQAHAQNEFLSHVDGAETHTPVGELVSLSDQLLGVARRWCCSLASAGEGG